MYRAILILALLAICSIAQASETSHRAAVEKMFQASNAEKMIDSMYSQMESMIEQQFKQMDLPEDAKPIMAKYQNKIWNITKSELSWMKIKDDMASAYMNVYSENEINELTKFYKSPVGIKFINRMPELTQQMFNLIQNRIPALLSKLEQIEQEMKNEIELSKSKAE